jgi:hypothetical protein
MILGEHLQPLENGLSLLLVNLGVAILEHLFTMRILAHCKVNEIGDRIIAVCN